MKSFDLEDRTKIFSKEVINFCRKITSNRINDSLVRQLVRSATSVGANYREANETDTKKDFRNKVRISKKEAKETIYWLELVLDTNSEYKNEILLLIEESQQLMKILASIYSKTV